MTFARWLVLHSLLSYSEHPDLIGVSSNSDHTGLAYPTFAKIKLGDEIVYYAIRDSVIVGLFRIASDQQFVEDPKWGTTCVYKIRPTQLPPAGRVLDFRHLVKDARLDLIPSRQKWPSYLRGHACRPLSDHDYELMRKRVSDGPGLVPIPPIRVP